MQLTLNGTPITVDPIAAQEIVRRHLLGIVDEPPGSEALAMIDKPAGGKIILHKGEKLIGSYAGPDGKTTVAILLPGEKKNVAWKDALSWAKDQGGDLPNRVEALLLFQHHRGEFQREVYWTNEQPAEVSSYAWGQSFGDGFQDVWLQGYKDVARAVRRVAI